MEVAASAAASAENAVAARVVQWGWGAALVVE